MIRLTHGVGRTVVDKSRRFGDLVACPVVADEILHVTFRFELFKRDADVFTRLRQCN